MERIQPLSNYLPVKRNLKYPAFLFVAILFFISSYSCIEQFTPNINKGELQNLLVVEGQIADEEGPFRVKLSSTFEIDNMQVYSPPVYGAEVYIYDDKGNQFQLFYTEEGWYETENKHLRGATGNTYTLTITTEDGTQYESSPVLMRDVPDIGNVYFEDIQHTRFEKELLITEDWLNILVDSKDTTGETEYWKWDFEETWEVKIPTDSIPIQQPVPYIEDKVYFTNEKVNIDPAKETCWVTMPSRSIFIKSTDNNPTNEIKRMVINSIGPNEDKLLIKYSILVKQIALNKETYQFWGRLREANEKVGSIYDKIPSQIYGNIRCCDGKGKALGYFSASAVKTKRIFINPYEHKVKTESAYYTCFYLTYPEVRATRYYFGAIDRGGKPITYADKVWTLDKFCSDCREYGTNVKPGFWE